jgi:serpin B
MFFSNIRKRIAAFIVPAILATTAGADPASDQERLVAANAGFAFALLEQIAASDPAANIFISPFSISCALQMTAAGARGRTAAEMQSVLKTEGWAPDSLPAAFADLDRRLAAHQDVTLDLANGLWLQTGLHLQPAFADINHRYFQAGLNEVNFGDPQSAAAINDWASRQTRGKINQVVQFPFPPQTRLILANAIYFKGQWAEPFKQNLTQPRSFQLASGKQKQTPMMVQSGNFQYQQGEDFQAVKLPYNGRVEMELYLPATTSDPLKLLPLLSARTKVASGFARREGTVILPKFKLDYRVLLNGPLQALGMKSAFGSGADFSGIAKGKLYISQVLQKSFVDVNEEGTEAAAVTTVTVRASLARRSPPDRFSMILDRPF